MPDVPERLAAVPEIHADVADGPKLGIRFRRQGIEEPRLMGRGGTGDVFSVVLWIEVAAHLTEIRKSEIFPEEIQLALEPSEALLRDEDRLVDEDGSGVIDGDAGFRGHTTVRRG